MHYSILFRCIVLSLTKPAQEMEKGWTEIHLRPPSKAWLSLHRFLTKLITTHQHYVKIFCTRFHPNWSRNTNVQVYINLDPLVKYGYNEAEYCQTHACSTASSKLQENRAV